MADKMWLKTFNRDPGILGRTFVLNGVPTTLVGIMPPRFTKLAADLWRPVELDRGDAQMSRQYFMFQARLKPGVTLQQAAADMDVIAHRLAATLSRQLSQAVHGQRRQLGRQHRRAVPRRRSTRLPRRSGCCC